MSANPELFDGKYTVDDLRAMIAKGQIAPTSGTYQSAIAFMGHRAGEEAHQNAISATRTQQWAIRIAIAALLVSLGALGLSVVALSESHIHAPAKP